MKQIGSNRFKKVQIGGEETGNTSTLSPTIPHHAKQENKSYRWCFTYNNPEIGSKDILHKFLKENCKSLNRNSKIKMYIFQEETGAQGTPHLQGRFTLQNAMRLSALKKLFPKVHFERENNEEASSEYCCKPESRSGDVTSGMAPTDEIKWIMIINDAKKMLPNFETYYEINYEVDKMRLYFNYNKTKFMRKIYNETIDELIDSYSEEYLGAFLEHSNFINNL